MRRRSLFALAGGGIAAFLVDRYGPPAGGKTMRVVLGQQVTLTFSDGEQILLHGRNLGEPVGTSIVWKPAETPIEVTETSLQLVADWHLRNLEAPQASHLINATLDAIEVEP